MILPPSFSVSPELETMSYELHVLRAAADGVQPALLLKAPGRKAEYLFNVPDGFSRLAMEQKLTPSARLSCVLLTSLLPASTGGLGGLLLRLKHDGHGQMQLVGPQGSSSIIHSLRHICRWQHPKVFVSECRDGGLVPVFEDEYVVIVPLLAGDETTGCPWCLRASPENPTGNPSENIRLDTSSVLHDHSSTSDSSGSGSSDSSDDTASTGFLQSSSHSDEDSYEKSLSAFSAYSETGKDHQSKKDFETTLKSNGHTSNGAIVDGMPHSCGTQREGRDVNEFVNLLPQQRKRNFGDPLLEFEGDFSGHGKVKKSKAGQHSEKFVPGSNFGPTSVLSLRGVDEERVLRKETTSEDGNLMHDSPKSAWMIDGTDFLPASACEGELSKSSSAQTTQQYEWLISNSHQDNLPQLAEDSNPVYGRHPSTQAKVIISGVGIENGRKLNEDGDNNDSHERNPTRVLGYVSYLKKLNKAILFVDCTCVEDLESLRRHPALSCIHHNSESQNNDESVNMTSTMHTMSAIVHLTPHSLVESCDYQSWMSSMRSPAHVVMNERSPELGFKSSLAMLQRLNKIHQDIFPLPFNLDANSRTTQFIQDGSMKSSNVAIVDSRSSVCLRFCEDGTMSVDHHSVLPLGLEKISSLAAGTSELVPEMLFAKAEHGPRSDGSCCSHPSPNVMAAMEIKKRLLQQKETILSSTSSGLLSHSEDHVCEDVDRAFNVNSEVAPTQLVSNGNQPISLTPAQEEYVKFYDPASEFQLTFLGTGCAEPSKNRGSSSILLQVRGARGAMLLDAGEGAAGQLFRRFGERAARTVISSLQCIWLSHKHGDHVLGVLSILQMRSTDVPPLVIIGPHKVGQWLSESRETCSARGYSVPQFTYIHCDELSNSEQHRNNNQQHTKEIAEVLDAMQLNSMLSVKVFHCHDAFGIILNGRRGWKVVYSGDTRPCNKLIEAGRGCTLLIHEATFEDTLLEQAKFKRHSTVSEAVSVGWQMRARSIILTHFSQRYPEMVTLSGDSRENLCVAFDGMVVPSQLLGSLGKLLPKIRTACQKAVSIPAITETGEERKIEASSKSLPIHQHGENVAQRNFARESLLLAKHTRWLSNSDNEASDQCLDGGETIGTSVRWSSDSDEQEAEVSELKGSQPMRNGSREPTAETFSLPNSCEGGWGTALDSFEGIVGSKEVQRVFTARSCEVDRPSSNTRETAGPLGGKHVRWIDSDSDSEDG